MDPPNPNKRLCRVQNPNSLPNVPGFNQNHVDLIISSFLSLPDLPSLSSPLSISCSFDRAVEKLFEASSDDSVHYFLTDRTLQLASLLQESTKRLSRKRASLHNYNSWLLSHELTIQVFSMVDTKSLMQVSACCTMFKKCAMDSLCYSHIDLTTGNVGSRVVRSMILNAGKELRNVCRFLDSLLTGHFRFIRHIDVSNNIGLLYGGRRFSKPEFPLEELNEERPGLTFVADFESPPPSSSAAAAAESDFRSSSSSSSSSSYSSSSSSGDSSSGSGTEDDDD